MRSKCLENQKSEIGNRKSEIGNQKSEIRIAFLFSDTWEGNHMSSITFVLNFTS